MKSFQALSSEKLRIGLSLVVFLIAAPTWAKVPVSVAKFTDKTASGASVGPGCHGYYLWADRLGDAFSDLLVESLGEDSRLEVLERDAIGEVYDQEVALVNSQADKSIKRGQFKKAKITFVGVVDGFEYCEDGGRVGLNVGRIFGVGDITPSLRKSSASVSVLIRAIDTTTGRILAQSRAKKKQSRKSIGLWADISSIDFSGAKFKASPLGETIRDAIQEAGSGVVAKLKI